MPINQDIGNLEDAHTPQLKVEALKKPSKKQVTLDRKRAFFDHELSDDEEDSMSEYSSEELEDNDMLEPFNKFVSLLIFKANRTTIQKWCLGYSVSF